MAAVQQQCPDLDLDLAAVSLVRVGTPQTVERLCRLGARIEASGGALCGLVLTTGDGDGFGGGDAPDREGALPGVAGGWVLLGWSRRHRVLIVLPKPQAADACGLGRGRGRGRGREKGDQRP